MAVVPGKMSGVLLVGHGGPEMLRYDNNIPTPKPKQNEVVIRVSAAGVNNTDINTRIGWYSKSDQSSEDASWAGQALADEIAGKDQSSKLTTVFTKRFAKFPLADMRLLYLKAAYVYYHVKDEWL